ncbi:MAG TPA: four helix bundle protein [Anaerolineales bacterium]|nr:four helix bundle protein [Anaerolineales bacterium]
MDEKSLETLEAWCKAREFCLYIYKEVLPRLPAEEKWNLGQQLRRAALSIPANIAEGYGRFYYQDNVRFCYNARGSLQKCVSHLIVAAEMQFILKAQCVSLRLDAEKLTMLVNGNIGYLKKSKQGGDEPGARYAVREVGELYEAEQDIPELETPAPVSNNE